MSREEDETFDQVEDEKQKENLLDYRARNLLHDILIPWTLNFSRLHVQLVPMRFNDMRSYILTHNHD